MEIKFNETNNYKSQQTLVGILQNHKFFFESINGYENTNFYLVIRYSEKKKVANFLNKLFGWAHKVNEERFYERRLSYQTWDEEGFQTSEPCVYTRNDILNILADTHENYVGEETL